MTFPPVWSPDAKILILGTYPSPKSREIGFYYGHPQNRFWPLMAELLDSELPETTEARRELLIRNRISIWDVLESCDITGASDSSIQNPVLNDLGTIIFGTGIEKVYANGSKAGQLFRHFMKQHESVPFRQLPSTSPANASYGFARLAEEWSCILEHLR